MPTYETDFKRDVETPLSGYDGLRKIILEHVYSNYHCADRTTHRFHTFPASASMNECVRAIVRFERTVLGSADRLTTTLAASDMAPVVGSSEWGGFPGTTYLSEAATVRANLGILVADPDPYVAFPKHNKPFLSDGIARTLNHKVQTDAHAALAAFLKYMIATLERFCKRLKEEVLIGKIDESIRYVRVQEIDEWAFKYRIPFKCLCPKPATRRPTTSKKETRKPDGAWIPPLREIPSIKPEGGGQFEDIPLSVVPEEDPAVASPKTTERTFDIDEDLGIPGVFPNDPEIIYGKGQLLTAEDLEDRAAAEALDAAATREAARQMNENLLDAEMRKTGEWQQFLEENPPPATGGEVDWGETAGSSSAAIESRVDPDWYRGLSESIEIFRAGLGSTVRSTAASAFDAYAASMQNAAETGHFTMTGLGKSLKASAKQSLLSIGQQAMAKGVFEMGSGIKAFAEDDTEGGQKHMSAAGQFFAVAALAGAGAGAIGGKGGGGKKKKGDEVVAPTGTNMSGSVKSRVVQEITVIGNPTQEQVRGANIKPMKSTRH